MHTIIFYNIVFSCIGLFYCQGQINDYFSSNMQLNEYENFIEIYVDNNSNKVTLSIDDSNYNNWRWNKLLVEMWQNVLSCFTLWTINITEFQNVSSIPLKKVVHPKFVKKLEEKVQKRIPRDANSNLNQNKSISSELYENINNSSTEISSMTKNSTKLNTNLSKTINSSVNYLTVINTSPIIPSITNFMKSNIINIDNTSSENPLSSTSPHEKSLNLFTIFCLFIITIMAVGTVLIVLKKYQCRNRRAYYNVRIACRNNNETTV